MAISYHVYANDGQGGAVDYSRAIATITAASATPLGQFTPGPLAAPSDTLFAVRAFDDVSGVEEANTDARVRIVIDADGRDVSSQPNAVAGLAVRWTVGEVCLVSWGYFPAGQEGPPTRFEVTTALPAASDVPGLVPFPSESVAYVPGVAGYGCRLEGLATTSDWTIQVRAVGESEAIVGPPASATLKQQSRLLVAVDGLNAISSA